MTAPWTLSISASVISSPTHHEKARPVESETRIELLTRGFPVVHIQISEDEFESKMDGGRKVGKREDLGIKGCGRFVQAKPSVPEL